MFNWWIVSALKWASLHSSLLLFQFISHNRIQEGDQEVSHHHHYDDIPNLPNQRLRLVRMSVVCKQSRVLRLDATLKHLCGVGPYLIQRSDILIHKMFWECKNDEECLQRYFVYCLSDKSRNKKHREWNLQVTACQPCQIKKWVRDLAQELLVKKRILTEAASKTVINAWRFTNLNRVCFSFPTMPVAEPSKISLSSSSREPAMLAALATK